MTYANLKDVSDRLGKPIVDSQAVAQVTAWLSDAENIILSRIPDLAQKVEDGIVLADVVKAVEANAVIRKIRNPDGKQNERIDDYSYGLNAEAARGEVYLTDEEWAILTPSTSNEAFSIIPHGYATVLGRWVTPDVWVPLP